MLEAEAVLPPGQSGYVSITGVATGTGSPHLTDQIDLFSSFEYKPLTFDQPGETEAPRPGVSIVRDAYGVPAITGQTDYDAWWGVGYAVAQDRLFQLELFRRATSGRLAEILGSTYLDDDLIARRDYYTDAEIDAMIAAIPAELRSRAEAYRDGINAWIEHVSQPGFPDMPGEFVALDVLPIEPWTRPRHRAGRRLPRPHRALGRRQRAAERAGPRGDRPASLRAPAPGPDRGTSRHRAAIRGPLPRPAGPQPARRADRRPQLAPLSRRPRPRRGSPTPPPG